MVNKYDDDDMTMTDKDNHGKTANTINVMRTTVTDRCV